MSDWKTVDYYMRMSGKPVEKHCPQCHVKVDEEDRFCKSCGEPLSNVKSGILLDLERAKQDKEERSLLLVALAFVVGGIIAGKESETFMMALLNTLLYGGGVLLIGGVVWIALYALRNFIVDGREGKFGIKAIFCIVVAVVSAAIAYFM